MQDDVEAGWQPKAGIELRVNIAEHWHLSGKAGLGRYRIEWMAHGRGRIEEDERPEFTLCIFLPGGCL